MDWLALSGSFNSVDIGVCIAVGGCHLVAVLVCWVLGGLLLNCFVD